MELEITIDEQGTVIDTQVVRPLGPELGAAAVQREVGEAGALH